MEREKTERSKERLSEGNGWKMQREEEEERESESIDPSPLDQEKHNACTCRSELLPVLALACRITSKGAPPLGLRPWCAWFSRARTYPIPAEKSRNNSPLSAIPIR